LTGKICAQAGHVATVDGVLAVDAAKTRFRKEGQHLGQTQVGDLVAVAAMDLGSASVRREIQDIDVRNEP